VGNPRERARAPKSG